MRFLLIQTAFLGDVVLATPVIEALTSTFPDADVDFVLRKGNEGLLAGHPGLRKLWIWDKKTSKHRNLFRLALQLRRERYDVVINLQRFFSSGLLTWLIRPRVSIGFDKNPLSALYTHRFSHIIAAGVHETDRNLSLLQPVMEQPQGRMALYPSQADFDAIRPLTTCKYVCLAPASVWFTKQMPVEKWVALSKLLANRGYQVYLIGSPQEQALNRQIITTAGGAGITDLAGKLSLLQSAALMQGATMNYVNDSAPMHLASAVNAPVTAIFCSTIPAFGFGPRSDKSYIVETSEHLDCRPCGLHGFRQCPRSHFRCGTGIDPVRLSNGLF